MDYTLEAASTGDANLQPALTLEILRDGAVYNGGWVRMGFDQDYAHSYTLRVTWPEGVTGDIYMNKTQTVKISMQAIQVD